MSLVLCIAREEWRLLRRDRVAMFGLALLTLLTLLAALTAYEHQRATAAERSHYQAQANQEFHAQPDRHPHRMAHYGHFLFRPLNPLAAFDPGIDAYTGHTLFLEAHRQNSANFGDVRQSSLLLRFGQLTPAFILQVLAPLLLIFVGHATVARERESGTLRILLAQGVGSRQIVRGKLLALAGLAGLMLAPAAVALAGSALMSASSGLPIALLIGAYACWLLIWALAVVLVSALFARGRDALLALLALWAVLVILLPRVIPDLANASLALPTRFETTIAVERDLAALGDSHNPNDPYFLGFRQRVLEQYGVSRIEDLPVNYKGLLAMEGERINAGLFNRYAAVAVAQQQRQNHWVDAFAWLSPSLALRRLSMTAAGTDLSNFQHFLDQGEAYRFALVQHLNKLEAEEISYADDTNPNKENRIAHSHWQRFPAALFTPLPSATVLQHAAPGGGVLLVWLALLAGLTWPVGRRLGRTLR